MSRMNIAEPWSRSPNSIRSKHRNAVFQYQAQFIIDEHFVLIFNRIVTKKAILFDFDLHTFSHDTQCILCLSSLSFHQKLVIVRVICLHWCFANRKHDIAYTDKAKATDLIRTSFQPRASLFNSAITYEAEKIPLRSTKAFLVNPTTCMRFHLI